MRRAAAYESLRRTLMITPEKLTAWVTERVARLEPGAARDPPAVDTREEELTKLIAKIRLHVAHNEMSTGSCRG